MNIINEKNIPRHIAIIMDGNGRWADKKGVPKLIGHDAGMKAMKEIVKRSSVLGVEHLTVYAFSTENWKRSTEEVKGIFNLLIKYVNMELDELNRNNVIVNVLGDYSKLPDKAIKSLEVSLDRTKNNKGLNFNIALNYGSRAEMMRAVKKIATSVNNRDVNIDDIDEEMFESYLYTAEKPDPDLIIRTSGEERLSNFLLWQAAYSEFVFTDVLWPDFTPEEYEKCISIYQNRKRRFGGR